MTGYGRGTSAAGDVEVTVEARTLNHRYLEINLRLSGQYAFIEPHIRKTVRKFMSRGKADVTVTVKDRREKKRSLSINKSLLRRYLEIEKELSDTFGLSGSLGLDYFVTLNGIISVDEAELPQGPVARSVTAALDEAMKGVCRMRRAEGKSIERYLSKSARGLGTLNKKIDRLSGGNKVLMGKKMKERIEEYLKPGLTPSAMLDDRLAVEIALLADKLDISEEVSRIGSHLEQFIENLRSRAEPVGRKLDFILQELHREFNTIGSKSQSDKILSLVIEGKAHLEKMKEQVQNVE